MRNVIFALALTMGVCAVTGGCAHPPPTLSPAGQTAFKQNEVQKDLDLLRDVVVAANAQVPPIVSTGTTRTMVKWHKGAVTLVHDAPLGWKAELGTELGQLQNQLPAAEYAVIAKYVVLVQAVLQEVQ